MEARRLIYKNSRIAWYRYGSGPQAVLCFHGYGERSGSFEFLGKHAGDRFSFYAIDLPFHGDTEWNEGLDFSPADLLSLVQQILPATDPLVLGFSLGGRVGLSLYQCMPGRVKRIVLLAPDGLKQNPWYWFSTQTIMGNRLFRFTMRNPYWFLSFLRIFNKMGLVNASIFKFVNYYIGDAGVRELLYKRWTSLRKLKPSLRQIKKEITHNNTPTRIIYGKYDRIILSPVGERFRKGIEKNCSVKVIDAGHQLLHEKHLPGILAALST